MEVKDGMVSAVSRTTKILEILSKTEFLGVSEIARQEHEVGVVCVAVPVFSAARKPAAAISIAGPSVRMNEKVLPGCAKLIVAASREISKKLGAAETGA
jgi:DNA-binding IclR family transcriptional regulator